jgi:hypothetical protein
MYIFYMRTTNVDKILTNTIVPNITLITTPIIFFLTKHKPYFHTLLKTKYLNLITSSEMINIRKRFNEHAIFLANYQWLLNK